MNFLFLMELFFDWSMCKVPISSRIWQFLFVKRRKRIKRGNVDEEC